MVFSYFKTKEGFPTSLLSIKSFNVPVSRLDMWKGGGGRDFINPVIHLTHSIH